jgi:ribosome biogenesis GTPase A
MRALSATFVRGVLAADGMPRARLPEVAVCGRSNVGKSSLLNVLFGIRGLARVSRTPGRTREINFFEIAGRYHLVDLPGYGYARAPSRTQACGDLVCCSEDRDQLADATRGRATIRGGTACRVGVGKRTSLACRHNKDRC